MKISKVFNTYIYQKLIFLLLLIVMLAGIASCKTAEQTNELTNEELYLAAVRDAVFIDDDDIFRLVEVSENSPHCTWDEQGRLLMLTYHRFPDSYIPGEEYTLIYGEVWTFTDKEIIEWYKNNTDDVTDWTLRFKQLVGVPDHREYTHFSAFWTSPDDIIRPGYTWRLFDTVGAKTFIEEPSAEYKAWFDANIIWSYFDSAYPWTRLGYTYDWSAEGSKYGLSEFLVRKDAIVLVDFTMTVDEFVEWMEGY